MKKRILIVLVSIAILSCSEDKKNVKPLKKFTPESEIDQSIENTKALILFEQAEREYEKRNYRKAINILNTALTFEESPIIYHELGTVSQTINELDEAIIYYKKGVNVDSLSISLII